MASGTTPVHSLPYPLETDTPDVAADMHSLALSVDTAPQLSSGILSARPGTAPPLGDFYYATDTVQLFQSTGSAWNQIVQAGESIVNQRAMTSSATANAGDFVLASPSITVTLPAPVKNSVVGVAAGSTTVGNTVITVAYGSGSGHIYAQGASAVSSIKLGSGQATVILQADGTNWQVIAGQQNTGWTALTLTSGVSTNTVSASGNTIAYSVTPAARLIGNSVLLRGSAVVTGHSSPASYATLPTGMHPTNPYIGGFGLPLGGAQGYLQISTGGVITDNQGGSANLGAAIFFDGVSFDIN